MTAGELKHSNETTDEVLIQRFKDGDAEAFNELVTKYQRKAYYLAYNMLSNYTDAEDISQEAFVRVYKNIYSFKGKSSFQTWFYKIIINLCRSHLRHRYLVARFSFHFKQKDEISDEPQKTLEDNVEDIYWQSSPLKTTINNELNNAINDAIQNLPKQQREVFILKHQQGLKISEISKTLKCAEGTVKANLFKAVKNLQEKLEKFKKEVT